MHTILEQLTQKIESFDSQLQTLALTRSDIQPQDTDLDTVKQRSSDQPPSDEKSNQDYLKSLSTMKVHMHYPYSVFFVMAVTG